VGSLLLEFNDIPVSFLQKWGGEAGKLIEGYSTFMAASEKSGMNNSGEYVLKTYNEGNLIVDVFRWSNQALNLAHRGIQLFFCLQRTLLPRSAASGTFGSKISRQTWLG
jgi:hypothetical protein